MPHEYITFFLAFLNIGMTFLVLLTQRTITEQLDELEQDLRSLQK